MKQPVWILNSSLLVVCCISQLLLFMLEQAVPRKVSMAPGIIEVEQEKSVTPVDITKIYQQDLFGTYQPPAPLVKSVVEDTIPSIPQPPKVVVPDVPVERTPTFFAPLDVVLKGVIFVKDDPTKLYSNSTIEKTKEERNYQVGDLIEDAQILKILSNRIILIRSNGQQETLYLREEDAVSDFNTEMQSEPKLVVEQGADNKYIVNIDEFVKRIHNLGEFINLLDLTTVYRHGKSFGCRIGKIEKDSLGSMLGFIADDIIVKVDGYDVDDLAHRIEVYDHIIGKQSGQMIEVLVYRGSQMVTLRYALVDNALKSITLSPEQLEQRLMEELSKHEADAYYKVAKEMEKAVVIQNMLDDNEDLALANSQRQLHQPETEVQFDQVKLTGKAESFNFDPALQGEDGKYKQLNLESSSKGRLYKNEQQVTGVSSLTAQTLNEVDMRNKRLMHERDKLTPTVSNLRAKDRNNMRQRSSKNMILQGMQ